VATHFLVVPEWQGSGSSRAMRLTEGAAAIQGDLPASATTVVDVATAAGEALGSGVHRYSSLATIRLQAAAAIAELRNTGFAGTILTIGGDCAADGASVAEVLEHHDPGEVAVVWFDAHGDLNTPESSDSGAFSGMALRALLGSGAPDLALAPGTLRPGQVVLAGARALDDAEAAYIETAGVRTVGADELGTAEPLLDAIAATGARSVYVHVDLDVIDPAEITGVGYPEPFGVSAVALADAIKAVRARFPLAGAAITGFAPESADSAGADMPVILRTLGALTATIA
jgi:arginase